MYKIVEAEFIAPNVKRFIIEASKIAQKRKAGQFVIVRIREEGERIPLTIADSDNSNGTITLIVQGIGKTTKELNEHQTGDYIMDVVGPLGKPSHYRKFWNCNKYWRRCGNCYCLSNGSSPKSRLVIIQLLLPEDEAKSL